MQVTTPLAASAETYSTEPSCSGARALLRMRPPAASCQPSKSSTEGSMRYSGFWAPTCFCVKKGPSR